MWEFFRFEYTYARTRLLAGERKYVSSSSSFTRNIRRLEVAQQRRVNISRERKYKTNHFSFFYRNTIVLSAYFRATVCKYIFKKNNHDRFKLQRINQENAIGWNRNWWKISP